MSNEDEDKTSGPTHDLALELIIGLLNRIEDKSDGQTTQPITLFVKGLIVGGTVISRKEFFRSHPLLEHLDETLDRLGVEGKIPKRSDDDPIYYIHLKDAHVFSAGQPPIPGNTGLFWRGRLDSIDGFALGGLEVRKG